MVISQEEVKQTAEDPPQVNLCGSTRFCFCNNTSEKGSLLGKCIVYSELYDLYFKFNYSVKREKMEMLKYLYEDSHTNLSVCTRTLEFQLQKLLCITLVKSTGG
jgi:hypothetical protein